jgi:MYXO-CTERM domain-containing protein
MRTFYRSVSSFAGLVVLLATASPSFAADTLFLEGAKRTSIASTPASAGRMSARAAFTRFVPRSGAFDLSPSAQETFDDGTVTHFSMKHKGLPVLGADAVVRLDASGQAAIVVNALPAAEALPDIVPTLMHADAARIAAALMSVRGRAIHGDLVVFVRNDVARLAWRFEPAFPLALAFQPRILIDAEDGRVLEARNRVVFAESLRTHRTNPVKSPSAELLPLPMPVEGDTLANPFLTAANCIDKKRVADVDFGFGPLKIHVCDVIPTAIRNASGDFDYQPKDGTPESGEDPFAEASIFYHTSRAYEFFRDLQGDPNAQVVTAKPLQAIANLRSPAGITMGDLTKASNPDLPLEPFQNAFFSPGGGIETVLGVTGAAMVFGQGARRDFAYDGDVVYHEFTHAVVDKTLQLESVAVDAQGASAAPGSMNEGLADYFASALSGDPDVGEYAAQEISQNSGVIRTLANKDACPGSLIGEVHADSTFFSGALWEARASLAEDKRRAFDVALYKAMRTSPAAGAATYEKIASLFISIMEVDFSEGSVALKKAFAARNVLPVCKRVLSADAGVVKAPSYGARRESWTAFGTAETGGAPLAPGLLQFSRTLAAGTTRLKVNVKFPAASGGGGGFGGGTPFKPQILVRFGESIQWSGTGKKLKDNADEKRTVAATGAVTETFDVPEGASFAFVQIGNLGSQAGGYSQVELLAEGAPLATTPDAGPGPGVQAPTDVRGGCACSEATGNDVRAWTWLPLLGLAALFARRKSQSQSRN